MPAPSSYPDLCDDVHRLRRTMSTTTSSLDFPFCEPELQRVLQQLPANRAPGRDGLKYELFRVDDDALRSALLALFGLVRYTPLHKSGTADEFTNYRPISFAFLCLEGF